MRFPQTWTASSHPGLMANCLTSLYPPFMNIYPSPLFISPHYPCPVPGTPYHLTGGAQLPFSRGVLEAVAGLSPGCAISGSEHRWAWSRPGSTPYSSVTGGQLLGCSSLTFPICKVNHNNTQLSMLKSSRWHTVGPRGMATVGVCILPLL